MQERRLIMNGRLVGHMEGDDNACTVYPKKYAHGFCFALLYCGYTLTDFPISIRLTPLALWQSNDCPSACKATLMNMDEYFIWIHYERLRNHNKANHNKNRVHISWDILYSPQQRGMLSGISFYFGGKFIAPSGKSLNVIWSLKLHLKSLGFINCYDSYQGTDVFNNCSCFISSCHLTEIFLI